MFRIVLDFAEVAIDSTDSPPPPLPSPFISAIAAICIGTTHGGGPFSRRPALGQWQHQEFLSARAPARATLQQTRPGSRHRSGSRKEGEKKSRSLGAVRALSVGGHCNEGEGKSDWASAELLPATDSLLSRIVNIPSSCLPGSMFC